MIKRKLFVDMDGVIVDFDGYMLKHNLTADAIKQKKGAYLEMEPIPGALEALKKVIAMGFDVWIATKPPTGVSHAYSDKAEWVFKHIPELSKKIIITPHKGLLGDENDILCDDRPHKAFCSEFKGTVIPFVDGYHWNEALLRLSYLSNAPESHIPIMDEWIMPGDGLENLLSHPKKHKD